MTFPGGELEGKRPRALCPACRELLTRAVTQPGRPAHAGPKPICFQCYRAELERDRALRAAGQLDTASDGRFQCTLPFDPVNPVRLAVLKAERAAERQARGGPAGLSTVSPPGISQAIVSPPGISQAIERCADRRRRAQIAARHALLAIGQHGLRTQQTSASDSKGAPVRRLEPPASSLQPLLRCTSERTMSARTIEAPIHAADLQLPESWLPFVVSR
jgi:hypothetical protein